MANPSAGISLFNDLVTALGKVTDGLKAIINLPKTERQKYRNALGEIFTLIDTTLNMVIIRLGDILYLKDDAAFLEEIARLDNYEEWLKTERQFRLCQSLRVAYSEAEHLTSELPGQLSIGDWEKLLREMGTILRIESGVAFYISAHFRYLAKSAYNATDPQLIRKQVEEFRNALVQERQQLIQYEIGLYSIV